MSVDEELNSMHRYELQDRYLELTRVELPAEARKKLQWNRDSLRWRGKCK